MNTRWQEGHVSVLSIRGAVLSNLFSSGDVKYFVRIIRVAKQTLIQAIVPSPDKSTRERETRGCQWAHQRIAKTQGFALKSGCSTVSRSLWFLTKGNLFEILKSVARAKFSVVQKGKKIEGQRTWRAPGAQASTTAAGQCTPRLARSGDAAYAVTHAAARACCSVTIAST